MKTKIAITVITIIAFVGLMTLALLDVKVDLENSWDPPQYTEEGTIQTGMSAYALFSEALDNYYSAEDVIFVRSLDFTAGSGVLILGTQQTIEITKFSGNSVFHQVTKQGYLAGASNEGYRFYFDGTNGYEYKEDSETRFPELGVEDWDGLSYGPYQDEEMTSQQKADDLRQFSSYVITEDTLSASHDDNVYLLDGKYYISITINCMDIELNGVQAAVEESIMSGLGATAEPGSFLWREDTVIFLEITKIGDDYFFTARNMKENYSARQSGLRVPCTQSISGSYAYDQSVVAITDDEKMNLA